MPNTADYSFNDSGWEQRMDHSEKHEGGGWRCRGDKTSQPWKPKKAEAEWALVAPTWNSSIWMAEAG